MAIGDGPKHQHKIFFYDFAFSEHYLNEMGEPKRREKATVMNGTACYFSIDVLRGLTSHVRKDELFSFGVCLLDMNNADLPWMKKTIDVHDIFEAMKITLNEWEKHGIEVSLQIHFCIGWTRINNRILFFCRQFVILQIIQSYF